MKASTVFDEKFQHQTMNNKVQFECLLNAAKEMDEMINTIDILNKQLNNIVIHTLFIKNWEKTTELAQNEEKKLIKRKKKQICKFQ